MPEIKSVNIHGYDTIYAECEDAHGKFLLIDIPSNADQRISDIAGQFVDGYFIKEVAYHVQDGKRAIKAYF